MGIILNRRRVMGGKSLPYDAEIEYLESDGSVAYINSNIVPLVSDRVYVEYMWVSPLDTSTDGSATLYGSLKAWNTNGFSTVYVPHKNLVYVLSGNNPSGAGTSIMYNNFTNTWLTETRSNGTVNTCNKNISYTTSGSCILPMYIFACSNNGRVYGVGTKKRIRSFKMQRGGSLILDLIPVRVGQVGYMYDKVSEQLFGNAGTGSFILGPDV